MEYYDKIVEMEYEAWKSMTDASMKKMNQTHEFWFEKGKVVAIPRKEKE